MVHLNYAINIWLFLNNKGSHTTSRHKKEEMIKKSAMAPIWQVGESARAARGSRARQPGLRGHQGEESTQLLLCSIRPSSTAPSVCQDKQMRRHMLERLLENYWKSFSMRARWKEARNTIVFTLLLTVTVCFLNVYLYWTWMGCRSASITLKCVMGFFRFSIIIHPHTWLMLLKLHYQMRSVILGLLNSNCRALIHNDLSHWEKNKLMKS